MAPSALVLNTTYEPLCVVPIRRATVLVLTDKAVALCHGDALFRSERITVTEPTVVRLTRFVRVPYRGTIALTRRAVFTRDSGRCVYCGAGATTIDHVVPRSRGGSHAWENVVAACTRCNHRKADRTLGELGWRLHRQPKAPVGLTARVLGHRSPEPSWMHWFGTPAPALA